MCPYDGCCSLFCDVLTSRLQMEGTFGRFIGNENNCVVVVNLCFV